jgi:lysophospholipase L1-like esterase
MNTNPGAKVVVCYGDSNTWGAHPFDDDRFPANIRWVGVVQDLLGPEYEVINEGLCGRTFVAEDPVKPFRTGIAMLK